MDSKVKQNKLQRNQSGMAALLITMVMLIVISLIVLGFATIARREQRQSLDRQLSTQAFYAAESGINDVVQSLNTGVNTNQATYNTNCNSFIADKSLNPVLNNSAGVRYTCLLVNKSPTSLPFKDPGSNSRVIPINTSTPIDHITLSWQAASGLPSAPPPASGCSGLSDYTKLPPTTGPGWRCVYGLARVDLVPTPAGGFTRSSLATNTMTGFFVPTSSAVAAQPFLKNATGPVTAAIYQAGCTIVQCRIVIGPGLGGMQWAMRVRFLYQSTAQFTVTAFDAGGNPLPTSGSQIAIDATGKAADVLRRIQVRVDLNNSGPTPPPDFALQTKSSICKKFTIIPIPLPGDPIGPSADPACPIP